MIETHTYGPQIKKKQYSKKKKKYSFTIIAKKIDHTLLKISYLFCYVFAAKLAVAIPQTFTRISFSIKHNHDYNIDP